MSRATGYDAAVVGGGFYGCMIALHLRRRLRSVVLLEQGARLMRRASYGNQARVHNGYHYPRSFLTAFRSRVNSPRFASDFGECIGPGPESYYAVARRFSKVSAAQYRHFMERVGAPIAAAPEPARRLFDPGLIEEVFAVREPVFDAEKLADRMGRRLAESGVEVRLGCETRALAPVAAGTIRVECASPGGPGPIRAARVFNCTYSRMNRVLANSGLPLIPLKHELAEMALIEVPPPLRGLGVTVMCGPFFSVLPFPPLGCHTLSHVRFTPHASWCDGGRDYRDPDEVLSRAPRESRHMHMLQDAARYVPALARSAYAGSLWEVKTVLPASEASDSRPILIRAHHGLPNLHCILGAKIDNVYDALDEIDRIVTSRLAG